MWMIFDAGEETNYGKALTFWGTATTGVVSCVFMLNGIMVVGHNNGSDNGIYVGIHEVNFINDYCELISFDMGVEKIISTSPLRTKFL